jgi:hypothetical protein
MCDFHFQKKRKLFSFGHWFFIGIGDLKAGFVIYLITAKHVLLSHHGDVYSEVYLSLNARQGRAELFKLTIPPNFALTHLDKNVDIICIPCTPDAQKYDYLFLTDSYLSDKEVIRQKQIREGNHIFYAGLFNPYFGNEVVEPLVRFGRVSSLTNEKIGISKLNESPEFAQLYLFECQSLGGFSGSPVFFEIDRLSIKNQIHYGNPEIYLAGVMKGHYYDFISSPVLELKDNILRELNLGISAVTPCYMLKEILYSPSEIQAREDLRSKKNPNIG